MRIIPFTKLGFEELEKQLEIEVSKRPDAVKTLTRAREMGDLSENGLYKAAKQELNDLDRNIRNLKYLIKYAHITVPTNNNFVQIGHKVLVETEGEKKEFLLVGEYEVDPKQNKISNKSPIGHNLMGRKVGENISITTPNRQIEMRIISIS